MHNSMSRYIFSFYKQTSKFHKIKNSLDINVSSELNYSSVTTNHYDIIIAGGGMVGTTLACTLGKNKKLSDKKILLLEETKQVNWKFQPKYSNRVSALNPNTINLLNKIGAWKHIADGRYAPVKKLQVWDAISDATITFNNSDLSDVVAYIVENDLLLVAVGKELKQLKAVNVINEAKIKDYFLPQQQDEVVTVTLENGKSYTCNLLLGCDGGNSKVRSAMNVNYISWNYNQRGVVATLKLSDENDNVVAWQRFLPTGPITLLPLNNNMSSLVWSTTINHANELLELTDEQFVNAVNDAIWKVHQRNVIIEESTKSLNKLLEIFQLQTNMTKQLPPSIANVETGSRAAFPLGFGHATNYVANRVALIGDAAHRVHPLAGQGVNLGFGDVIALNNILGDAVYSGSSFGNLSTLNKYETERQRHNLPTMLAIDGLHKLYNTEFTPIVVLRSLGLQITNALSPLKKAIIGHAAQ